MITSPISNKQPPGIVSCFLSWFCMRDCCNATGADKFTFRHTQKIYDMNFGEIICQRPTGDHPKAVVKNRLVCL